ncbi:flagellar hook-basal body complex protein [Sporolactobacillus spathodeae]|uniref:Flagellar hook protein FlgE n=1 Tax=Sporolactobacillus spathodeae TaxID=1465502 RepID=A0ABS2Q5F4_9BACL|nr:flagellar hook-basal body complex protein [Sporolactobacillus spathodeae]MBM7656953.1 flagellar hook protein FlgE [Sporolactobacillus spathodeae]
MLLRSLGAGVSGLKNFQTDLDVIGNNIANVGTTGYKKSRVNFEDTFSQQLQGASTDKNAIQIGLGSEAGSIDNIISGGTIDSTDNPYDLAIDGEGYFLVKDSAGNGFYTRAGDFKLNSNGTGFVNSQGLTLDGVGTAGGGTGDFNSITSFTVAPDGTVTGVSGNTSVPLGAVSVYTFKNPGGLEKTGNSLYLDVPNATGGATKSTTVGTDMKIQQGALEGSNVDLTDEMTNLITAQRAYQANARTITTADDILQELIQLKRN